MSEPSSPDIVAELDRWLDQPAYEQKPRQAMRETSLLVCRARDEIKALRARLEITAKSEERTTER